ncbi:unnamed protein product [Gordionus sp. m RMFG-2023]|uniref:uncharacterized protein LOC135926379 n=1 Tax=Gordionus sp. m RMFG-2023 TaxID=3053472 RepID=UPI0030DE046E
MREILCYPKDLLIDNNGNSQSFEEFKALSYDKLNEQLEFQNFEDAYNKYLNTCIEKIEELKNPTALVNIINKNVHEFIPQYIKNSEIQNNFENFLRTKLFTLKNNTNQDFEKKQIIDLFLKNFNIGAKINDAINQVCNERQKEITDAILLSTHILSPKEYLDKYEARDKILGQMDSVSNDLTCLRYLLNEKPTPTVFAVIPFKENLPTDDIHKRPDLNQLKTINATEKSSKKKNDNHLSIIYEENSSHGSNNTTTLLASYNNKSLANTQNEES